MSCMFVSVKLIMILKPLFSNKKINSLKIKKDYEYFNTFYKIYLPQYEKVILEQDIMKMKFILVNNLNDLKYLANNGIDRNRYGFYYLSGLGNALITVQNNFRINKVNLYKVMNMFVVFKDDDIDMTLLRNLLIEKVPFGELTKGIVKYYKFSNHYNIKQTGLISKLFNTNIFEIIKSRHKDNLTKHYKNLMKKFVSELLNLIKDQYDDDMFLYKNIITNEESECTVRLEYSMILTLHYQPKLYIGISLAHIPYIYVQSNNVQYIKTIFILFKVVGDDMKLNVYEYYISKEINHKDQYKLLLDIDLKNTKFYKKMFPEVKSHFDNIKNEKVVFN